MSTDATRRGGWRRRAASVVLVLAVSAGALAACAPDPLAEQYRAGDNKGFIEGEFDAHAIPVAERGDPVEFAGTTESGQKVSNADYSGDVVVVNFWYAQCGPCRAEAPVLEEIAQEYAQDGAEFLGVNIYDQAESAKSFAETYGVSYPSVIDINDKAVTFAFASYVPLSSTPVTLVLDREGRVAARIIGQIREQDASVLSTLVRETLAEDS